ncbi:MAG: hypothetical protein J0M15_15025 [Deltaproteobacteria bacterium]|nr:hypothetical protein [Deltaproteobacteria bacterium]
MILLTKLKAFKSLDLFHNKTGLNHGLFGTGVTCQGQLIDPSGNPVVASSVQFKVQIRSSCSEECLLYEELQTKNLSETSGMFSLSLFDGSGSRVDSSGYTLEQIFANKESYIFGGGQCASGSSWTPNSSDGRRIQLSFNDGTFASGTWEAAPALPINYVPMAVEVLQVGGYKANLILKLADGVSTTGTELNNARSRSSQCGDGGHLYKSDYG